MGKQANGCKSAKKKKKITIIIGKQANLQRIKTNHRAFQKQPRQFCK